MRQLLPKRRIRLDLTSSRSRPRRRTDGSMPTYVRCGLRGPRQRSPHGASDPPAGRVLCCRLPTDSNKHRLGAGAATPRVSRLNSQLPGCRPAKDFRRASHSQGACSSRTRFNRARRVVAVSTIDANRSKIMVSPFLVEATLPHV
jgi:hypothetical protein